MSRNDLAARNSYNSLGAGWVMQTAAPGYTDALLSILLRHLQPGDRVLDICCGYGRLTLPLLQKGFDAIGVDISEILLRKGQELVRQAGLASGPLVQGNIRDLPVASSEFDFSFCVWASFNFLISEAEQLQAVQEMHRILKPGGQALIECPFHEASGPVEVVQIGQDNWEYYPLTISEMRVLAARSSFAKHDVFTEDVAGRTRMFALLRK